MHFIKTTLKIICLIAALTLITSCQKGGDSKTLKVGTIAGPETQLMVVAEQVAAKQYHLDIDIIPFTDYTMPNEALSDGSIDANMFQHQPYLDEAISKRGYHIVAIGKTFVYPMGVYSKKIKNFNELANGASVAIPNDPSNEARALLLLQKAGLITLKPGSTINATVNDIATNPKRLKFKEIDAAQLPRTLPDVDIAAINTNYAIVADLLPSRDALVIETSDSPYANLVVVRKGTESDPRFQQLMNALHSDEVLQEAKKLFHDQAIPAWK